MVSSDQKIQKIFNIEIKEIGISIISKQSLKREDQRKQYPERKELVYVYMNEIQG
jgi:hypothetical protein